MLSEVTEMNDFSHPQAGAGRWGGEGVLVKGGEGREEDGKGESHAGGDGGTTAAADVRHLAG